MVAFVNGPNHKAFDQCLISGGGVLEFLGDEEARNLRAGAVLPNEVHLLQFPYGSGDEGAVCAIRRGGLPGD